MRALAQPGQDSVSGYNVKASRAGRELRGHAGIESVLLHSHGDLAVTETAAATESPGLRGGSRMGPWSPVPGQAPSSTISATR